MTAAVVVAGGDVYWAGAHEELGEWAVTVNPFDVAAQAGFRAEGTELRPDEVTRNVKGRKETLEALKKHLDTAELVELVLSIGFWGMVARLLETTRSWPGPHIGPFVLPAGVGA